MTASNEFKTYNSRNSFNRIVRFKGEMAPIAEKASRNIKLKTENKISPEQRLHYFAIGHAFKQIDTENLFEKVPDDKSRKKEPTKFISLQKFDASFCTELQTVIASIRNINSHCVHDFQKLMLNEVSNQMISFLRESFELAVIQVFLKEKNIDYKQFIAHGDVDKELVNFLHDKFYSSINGKNVQTEEEKQKIDEYLRIRNYFNSLSKQEAIDSLLFVGVDHDFDWMLYRVQPVFKVRAGKYLSFYACLFMLSLFLYKNEAETLISKIKGFKKNKTDEEKGKREIFTFFSKKFSSRDLDSEESNLIKFRDIIQYLNHYPVPWNQDLELESEHPVMTDRLKATIIEMEISRCFPAYAGCERFRVFAKYQLWGKKYLGESIEREYIRQSFTSTEVKNFNDEINVNPKLKDAKKIKDQIDQIKEKPNPLTEKLKERIRKNLLFVSWGRNQDRFMIFAIRFLAGIDYFGQDAMFKTYCFYSTEEQNEELERSKESLSKKEYDKLRYHQGRPVHFITFQEHLKRYPEWDTPFVIENNAIQLKMTIVSGLEKIVSIQKGLMIYFLEDALFRVPQNETVNAGKTLLESYYTCHQKDFVHSKSMLEQQRSVTPEEKNKFKKILPKRLLHHYSPAVQNYVPESAPLELLLKKAENSEERYQKLLQKAEADGNKEDFIKHNKGKQFKLQFIRKAWNLMYFRDSYLQQTAFSGEHHKRYHITRDEFNDFCRFMFAFDEVPRYKDYLNEMFRQKGFFENVQFKALFQNGCSLDDLYLKTKKAFGIWMEEQTKRKEPEEKYSLTNYSKFFDDELFYINKSHFLEFLQNHPDPQRNELGKMNFRALDNVKYLIPEYYYADRLEQCEQKLCRKLYNKLRKIKLEDALLYEIALHDLQTDNRIITNAKSPVTSILKQNIEFDIQDLQKKRLYRLIVPFNQIDSFESLFKQKEKQEQGKFKPSFLSNIAAYLEKVKRQKDIEAIYKNFNKNPDNRVLQFDELYKINAHLMTNSIKFTRVAMALEEYFLCKPDHQGNVVVNGELDKKTGCYLVRFEKTGVPKTYFCDQIRNKAFHFGIPEKSYDQLILEIEKKFVLNEVKPVHPANFDDLSYPLRSVCNQFLNSIHNNYFIFREKNGKKRQQAAETKFFEQVILKS